VIRDFAVPAGCAPARLGPGAGGAWTAAHWTPPELAALAARLAGGGAAALASVPLARRLEVWNQALGALLDPESEERRALVPALVATARLSPEGLSEALEIVLGGWLGEEAERLATRAPRRVEAGLDGVVLAGNVPGLAAQCLLPALVAGRPLALKSSTSEPLFAPALVAALARREPALGEAFAAVSFPGAEPAALDALLAGARRVLAYGGKEALAGLGVRLGARLVGQGPKASVALVARDVDTLAVGRALARDVALLDQRGCLSVHAVFAEGDARELAEALAFGLAFEHRRLPPGPPDPGALARVQQWRGAAELGDALIGRLGPLEGTVVLTLDARFQPSPGLRAVRVHALSVVGDALAAIAPWRGRLQGAALAGAGALELSSALEALGVSRLAAPGRLQAADAGWENGGIDPLRVFA
jgi:hypothetical protein